MSTCIYYKKGEPSLHFTTSEHIFPAGIGGRNTLKVGLVSDEANAAFSPLELKFMRSSIIAVPRQFVGPGKRGSLSARKATQSRVQVMHLLEYGDRPLLAYSSLGKPHVISQVQISPFDDYHIELDESVSGDYWAAAKALIEKMRAWNGDAELQVEASLHDTVLLGYHENKWYLAGSSETARTKALAFVQVARKGTPFQKGLASLRSHFRANIRVEIDTDFYYRICAKTAFNFLCYDRGPAFVLRECFDPIRSWILNGGENTFVHSVSFSDARLRSFFENAFPTYSHTVILFTAADRLLSTVSFYGGCSTSIIEMSSGIEEDISAGFICDWRNTTELTLPKYNRLLNGEP